MKYTLHKRRFTKRLMFLFNIDTPDREHQSSDSRSMLSMSSGMSNSPLSASPLRLWPSFPLNTSPLRLVDGLWPILNLLVASQADSTRPRETAEALPCSVSNSPESKNGNRPVHKMHTPLDIMLAKASSRGSNNHGRPK